MDDARLSALLAADLPPAQDMGFQLSVMQRIARREFHASVVRNLGIGVLAMLVLALLAPALAGLGHDMPASNVLIAAMLFGATLLATRYLQALD